MHDDAEDTHNPTLDLFDLSTEGFAFTEDIIQSLELRRRHLGSLIFERLLKTGGIHATDLFPPTNVEGLTRLLDAIEETEYDALKRDCLVYYLLKFQAHDDGRSRLNSFLGGRSIPPQFILLADAYWELDTGENIAKAVSILSDPRLNRDYTSAILQAIAIPGHVPENYSPMFPHTDVPNITQTSPLIVRYIRTAKPLLVEPPDLRLYTIALAESQGGSPAFGFSQAWQYQRTFPEDSTTRTELIYLLIDWCFTPYEYENEHEEGTSLVRDGALKGLLSLPFTPLERSLIHARAISPPPHYSTTAVSTLRDLVIARLVSAGSYASAIRLAAKMALSAPAAATNGESYAGALRSQSGPRETEKAAKARHDLLTDVLSALPPAERAILEDETAQTNQYWDFGMSWADLSVANIPPESWEELPAKSHLSAFSSKVGRSEVLSGRKATESANASRFGLGTPTGPISRLNQAANADAISATPVQMISAGYTRQKTPISPSGISANRAPNAFFTPNAISTPTQAVDDEDMEETESALGGGMEVDDEDDEEQENKENEPSLAGDDSIMGGYSFSVFSGNRVPSPTAQMQAMNPEPAPARIAAPPMMVRSETEQKMPPGAFFPTPEPSNDPAAFKLAPSRLTPIAETSTPKTRRSRQATSTSPTSPKRSSKHAKHAADEEDDTEQEANVSISASRKRHVPGALTQASELVNDSNDSEDADEVPPLRTSARTSARTSGRTRKTLSTGAPSGSEDEDTASGRVQAQPMTRRRSSRLVGSEAADTSIVTAPAPKKRKPRASSTTTGKEKGSKRK